MSRQRVSFSNALNQQLAAYLDMPAQSPAGYALFAHCFTCNKNFQAVRTISQALKEAGFAVLRIDFTGLGESDGDFADSNFSSNVDDLVSAAHFLEEHYQAPTLLVGHSLGGAAVLRAALELPSVKAVATIAAPSEASHVKHLLSQTVDEIEAKGIAEITLAGRPFTIKKQFLDDLEASKVQACLNELKSALLILHSPVDNTVGINNAAEIFKAAKHPKSFISLDDADHLLNQPDDARYAGQVIASWAVRYLPGQEKTSKGKPTTLAVTGQGYRTEVISNGFQLIADEPENLGGTDAGPSPFDYLATALAACSSITVRMYADRKEWPLDVVSIEVKQGKAASRQDPKRNVVHFQQRLELQGELDASQRKRLLEIADRCPVHRTLTGEVIVDTELVPIDEPG